MSKMLLLYSTLTEMDSDFNWQYINFYTKTIVTYSGLSKDIVPSLLKELEKLNILKIVEKKKGWMFAGKDLIFTPDLVLDPEEKEKALISEDLTSTWKPVNGDIKNGTPRSEKSSVGEIGTLEDNIPSENIINKNNNYEDENKIVLLLKEFKFMSKDINELISKYNLSNISKAIKECSTKEKNNPIWFIKDALKNDYQFTNKKESENLKKKIADKKHIERQVINNKEKEKKVAQSLKLSFEKKLINDWITNNDNEFKELYKIEESKYNKKLNEGSGRPVDWDFLIKLNVRTYIKKDILWL